MTPEVRGSNPVIDKIYIKHFYCQLCIEKTKIKKKEAGNGPFFKNNLQIVKFQILNFNAC